MKQIRHIRTLAERDQFVNGLKGFDFVTRPMTFTYEEYKENKSREQEKKYHAMIQDISKQVPFCGKERTVEDWKRILMSAFRKEQNEQIEAVPGLRNEVVILGRLSTSELKSDEASNFIEFIYSEFPEVVWSDG